MDIRRFFAPSKPGVQKPVQNGSFSKDDDKKKKNKSMSSEEDVKKKKKNGLKITSPKSEEKPVDAGKKHKKKRAIIESDSEDEKPEKKTKKPTKESQKSPKADPLKKKDPVQYVSETDSDSDCHFVSLKKSSKPLENGTAKSAKKQEPEKPKSGAKNAAKSPLKATAAPARGKGGVKSPTVPVTPKSAPAPPPKRTPTSVADFFGGAAVQRSDKKLVASVKRKAPIQDAEDDLSDEFLAQQLQLEEDMELEKQIHEDEDFARTLAMHDEEPHAKKARKDPASHSTKSPKKSEADSAPSRTPLPSLSNEESSSYTEDVIGPTPQKAPLPTKPSSKLAMMKQRNEEEGEKEGGKKEEKKVKATLSPKKEPLTPTGTDRKSTPRTGNGTRVSTTTTPTTFKTSPKKSESTSPDDAEKKRGNSVAFRNYLNREGPRALGSKEIPQGAENCLEGCVFVITGVLEALERDEAKVLIERHGGKVTGNISKNTSYLVLGRDSGVSKTQKAQSLGTKILDEDGLLELIRTKPGKKSKYEVAAEAENKASNRRTPDSRPSKTTPRSLKASPGKNSPHSLKASPAKHSPSSLRGSPAKNSTLKSSPGSPRPLKASPARSSPRALMRSPARSSPHTPRTASPSKAGRRLGSEVRRGLGLESTSSSQGPSSSPSSAGEGASLLWVDKYRPRSLKAVIGQTGEASCANKLLRWLQNWHRHHAGGGAKPAAARFGKFGSAKDDGSSFKAALLSGPPGVGKTTTAALVCEELGYSYVEMNASCTRSKKNLKEVIAESLNNTSIKNFYTGSSQTVSSKHVLIMDEVDGMAGNEDRGGIQEMIGLIKQSKIPIICMCNDRNHQKIRSLANYCFDLRFQRPRVEQIKGAMMSIAFKEGIKVPPPALNEIILASNHDIRQVLHNLCMWSATDKVMTYDQATQDAKSARKDTKLGPFDVCRQVFSNESARMSLIDKSDLFFHDYSLGPLFIQENYPHVRPAAAGNNLKSHLVLLSKTADSICDGDLVDRQIRSRQAWNLLPTQAIYASVLPGELMRGYMSQFPSFPSWLGKFSSTGKHSRITQELAAHMSLKTLSGRQAVNLDYLPYLRGMLLSPLQRLGAEGATQAVQLMDQYHLVREDVDNIMEISVWGGQTDPYAKLDPKVKAAFTRAYNKEVHLTPYSLQPIKKGRRGGGAEPDLGGGETEQESQEPEEEEEGLGADAMIKQKKSKPSKESKEKKTGGTARGKEPKEKKAVGPARGRGRGKNSKK